MKKVGSLAIVDKEDKVLLVLEPSWASYGGQWNLPGGIVNPNEGLEAAAEREVFEETGIKCKVISIFTRPDNPDYDISIFRAEYLSGEIKVQQKEHDDAKWFSESEIQDLKLVFNTKEILADYFKTKHESIHQKT